MNLHFRLKPGPNGPALRERFAGVACDLDLTLTDGESTTGLRLLLDRCPDPEDADATGFFVDEGDSGIVEISPGLATRRDLLAAAWAVALAADLIPVRIGPGERSLVQSMRQIEDPARPATEEAARLAIFVGAALENGVTGTKELDLILKHTRPGRPHPFEVLNRLEETERHAVLERARLEAGQADLPWPLRRDLRSGTALAERRVALSFEDEVARIRLVRPQLLNALDPEMLEELADAWQRAEAHSSTRAIVLEAEGPAFMAGVDLGRILEWIESDRLDRIEEFVRGAHRFLGQVDESPQHTLVCLDGLAVGAGAEFCTAFDTVLATGRASVGFPELSLGIYPAMGGTQRLPRRIGYDRARTWILSAALLPAGKARAAGMVDALIDDVRRDPLEHARKTPSGHRAAKNRIARPGPAAGIPQTERWHSRAPVALSVAEALLELSLSTPLREGLAAEIAHLATVFGTREALAGIRRAQGRARRSRSV